MKWHEQRLKGVFLIEPEPFVDKRGMFRRLFCQAEFAQHGIKLDVRQSNLSENRWRHTLRGFHYQNPPYGEGKLLTCLRGEIYDIVVDLRTNSETYLAWISVELNEKNRLCLYVPPDCANAYLTLEDNTAILYYHSEFYKPCFESGIHYDDPFFNFHWPASPKVISEKDKSYPRFVPKKNMFVQGG